MLCRRITPVVLMLVCCLGRTAVRAEKMYWVDGLFGEIRRANLDGSELEVLVGGTPGPIDIALDAGAAKMYWTDSSTGMIQRAYLDGTAIEVLVTEVAASGIALDVAGGKMYWTARGQIQRANLQIPMGETPGTRTDIEDLVTGLSSARGIEVHAAGGKMYWTDFRRIQRADLDGANVEDLFVSTSGPSPLELALDIEGAKMYWVSAEVEFGTSGRIQRANLNGTGVEDLLPLWPDHGTSFGIALDAPRGKMYWTIAQGKIERADLDGSDVEVVLDLGSSDPRGIALDLTPPIPTVSEWGLIVMFALLITSGRVIIQRRGPRQNHCPQS